LILTFELNWLIC